VLERGPAVFLGSGPSTAHDLRHESERQRSVQTDGYHAAATSRRLGAATIPKLEGYLAGWILDHEAVKPGNMVPRRRSAAPPSCIVLAISGEHQRMAAVAIARMENARGRSPAVSSPHWTT